MGVGEARCLLKTNCHFFFSNIFMLIILPLAYSITATHLRPHSIGVCLSRIYWFSLLGSFFCVIVFCFFCFFLPWSVRAGSSCEEGKQCWTFERQTQISFLFYYQKTESQMTSSTVCALPSPVTFPPLSVMKWSQSLLLGDVERELKVLYLTDIWLQMFNK